VLCGRVMVPAAAMRMLAGTAIGAVMEKQMNKTIGAAALVVGSYYLARAQTSSPVAG